MQWVEMETRSSHHSKTLQEGVALIPSLSSQGWGLSLHPTPVTQGCPGRLVVRGWEVWGFGLCDPPFPMGPWAALRKVPGPAGVGRAAPRIWAAGRRGEQEGSPAGPLQGGRGRGGSGRSPDAGLTHGLTKPAGAARLAPARLRLVDGHTGGPGRWRLQDPAGPPPGSRRPLARGALTGGRAGGGAGWRRRLGRRGTTWSCW